MSNLYSGGSYRVGTLALTNLALTTFTEQMGVTVDENFNILTQTITNTTVIIEGTLDDTHWNDVTGTLFRDPTTGIPITSLASNSTYLADTYMTFKNLRISYTPTNATNAINLQYMVKKGGGR